MAEQWPGTCQVAGCNTKSGVIFQAWRMAPALYWAVFGMELGQDPDHWKIVCQRHYSYLKRKDGLTLGYRTLGGITRAYVRDESF